MSTYQVLLVPTTQQSRDFAAKCTAATNILAFSDRAVACELAGLPPDSTDTELKAYLGDMGFELYTEYTRPTGREIFDPGFSGDLDSINYPEGFGSREI